MKEIAQQNRSEQGVAGKPYGTHADEGVRAEAAVAGMGVNVN